MTLGISDEEFETAIDQVARPKPIDLAHCEDFSIGSLRVTPSLRGVSGPDGEVVLEPKVMQVLIALGDQVGTILSRDDLIERCWEGRVVGESSINRVISLLRSALKTTSGGSVTVENVPKVGYRIMVAPGWSSVSDEEAQSGAGDQAQDDPERGVDHSARWGSIVLACVLAAAMLVIVTVASALWPSVPPAPVEKIKVAMLPLKAGDGVDPIYARGLEAELRTQLARIGRFEVTSSESARQLFEKGLSADEICRKLGADYAWVGALNVEADRVTLTATLIKSATKERAYSETLSSAPSAAQSLPLRAARAVTTALGRPVSDRLPDPNVAASDYRLYLTALGLIKTRGDDQRQAALEILEQVTQRNPDFADGWAGLAKAWYLLPLADKTTKSTNRERASEYAEKALSLDPDALDALKVKGMLESTPPAQRLALLERATQLDPGDSEAWFWRSIIQNRFVLNARNPVASKVRMVEIDPLWPASWQAPEGIARFGDLDTAIAMEEAIASAAVTPSQRLLSEARQALMKGDVSEFLALTRQAQPTATTAERRFGAHMQIMLTSSLLDLPQTGIDYMASDMSDPVVDALIAGQLPTRAALIARGARQPEFWEDEGFVQLALPLFLRDGREAELAEYYDAAFPTRSDYLSQTAPQDEAETPLLRFSPYLALAFRRLGRNEDAAWHTERLRVQVERWRTAETGAIHEVLGGLSLAALDNDTARAGTLAQRLPSYGWPYTISHIKPHRVILMDEDPLYASLRNLPEVREVLDPIRANLAKEREEVLALGV